MNGISYWHDRWDILFTYNVKQHTGGANDICCGTGLNLCPGNPVPGWLEDKSNGEWSSCLRHASTLSRPWFNSSIASSKLMLLVRNALSMSSFCGQNKQHKYQLCSWQKENHIKVYYKHKPTKRDTYQTCNYHTWRNLLWIKILVLLQPYVSRIYHIKSPNLTLCHTYNAHTQWTIKRTNSTNYQTNKFNKLNLKNLSSQKIITITCYVTI